MTAQAATKKRPLRGVGPRMLSSVGLVSGIPQSCVWPVNRSLPLGLTLEPGTLWWTNTEVPCKPALAEPLFMARSGDRACNPGEAAK